MLFFLPLPCFSFIIPHSVSYHNRQATHQVVAGYTPTGIGRWLRSPESRYPFRTILETVVDLTQFNLVTPPTTVMAQLYETKYFSYYCCSLLYLSLFHALFFHPVLFFFFSFLFINFNQQARTSSWNHVPVCRIRGHSHKLQSEGEERRTETSPYTELAYLLHVCILVVLFCVRA